MNDAINVITCSEPKFHELWATVPGSYPPDYQTLKIHKGRVMKRALAQTVGRNVLEAGCNSGLYSLILSNYADSVVCVDYDRANIDRASLVYRYALDSRMCRENIRFVNSDIISALRSAGEVDCLVASLFLYYLYDEDLLVIQRFIRDRIGMLVVQCRPDRHKLVYGNPQFGNVSNLTLYNGLYALGDNIDFIRDCGFSDILILGLEQTSEEVCPVLIAKRPVCGAG